MDGVDVRRIPYEETYEWLMYKHYAHRIPSISYAFGLYKNSIMVGVCTFGTPSSSTLRNGILGEDLANRIIELNRLCVDCNQKNITSWFVSHCIKMLPKPICIVSYADTEQGHIGKIYQACNFIYTGLSAKRTDWKIKGMENLHGQTIADMSRGRKNRAEYMREKYGSDFYLKERPRKHRYVYFTGSKKEVKEMRKALKYPVCDYPLGQTKRYDASYNPITQGLLL